MKSIRHKILLQFLVSFFLFFFILVHSAPGAKWHEDIGLFYQKAAGEILKEAKKRGMKNIVLQPEVNESGYFLSCPANQDLAETISRLAAYQNGKKYNVYFWKGDIAPYPGWIGGLLLSGKSLPQREYSPRVISPKGNWYRIDGDINQGHYTEVSGQPTTSFNVALIINYVELIKDSGQYKAVFSIRESLRQDSLITMEFTGSTKQLRWFLGKKPNSALFYILTFLFLIFIIFFICLTFFGFRHLITGRSTFFNTETIIGITLVFCGIIIPLYINYIKPLHRERATYYDQTNIIFMIDNNSEILFQVPHENHHNILDICTIIKSICFHITERLSPKARPTNRSYNWWDWLRLRFHELIYGSRKYELNTDYGYFIHTASGEDEGKEPSTWQIRNFSGSGEEHLEEFLCQDRQIREPRLIIPKEEFLKIKKSYELPESSKNFAVLFTSASTSCEDNLEEYGLGAYMKKIKKFDNESMGVFSLFIPTIPRTGSDSYFDFEEGKLLLLREVSQRIININDGSQKKIKGNERRAQSIPPIFNHADLGVEHQDQWDRPRDLDSVRYHYFTLPAEKIALIESSSERIAVEFEKFMKDFSPESTTGNQHCISILAARPLMPLNFQTFLIALVFCLLITLMIAYFQYNKTSLDRWMNSWMYRWSEYALVSFSYILLMTTFLFLLYKGDNPQKVMYLGNIRLALLVTIGLWLSLFFGPFLVFRLHFAGKAGLIKPVNNESMRWGSAICLSLSAMILIGLALYLIPQRIGSILWKPPAIIGITFLPFLVIFILDMFNILPKLIPAQIYISPDRDNLAWWKSPLWACIIKLFLGTSLSMVIYGALWANPLSSPWQFPFNCSYPTLVLITGSIWFLIGMLIWMRK